MFGHLFRCSYYCCMDDLVNMYKKGLEDGQLAILGYILKLKNDGRDQHFINTFIENRHKQLRDEKSKNTVNG